MMILTSRTFLFVVLMKSKQFCFRFGRSSSCPPPEESTHHLPSPLPPAPPAPNPATGACPGVLINWNIEAGSAGWTFPWHRVLGKGATDSHTEFFRVEVDSEENTRGFSKECTCSTSSGLPCSNCAEIPARILELKDLATNMKPHMNYRFLNYQHSESSLTRGTSGLGLT
jgi:hypothetical protein